MQTRTSLRQGKTLSIAGLMLIAPASILVFGGILQSLGIKQVNDSINYDLFIFNPIILLGGLTLALGLNILTVMRVQYQNGNVICMIKIRGKLFNLGFIAFCIALCATIFLYLLAENLQIFAG